MDGLGWLPSGPLVSHIHVLLHGEKSKEGQEFMQF